MCLRIPRWVESTAGEVAATLRSTARGKRTPMGRHVTVALWGTGAVRVLTGFLTLFVAFVVREQSETDPAPPALLIGIVGAAAGVGSFTGNAVGSRRQFLKSDAVIMSCVGAAVVVSAVAALLPGIATAALVGLVGAAASALAKVCLDAVIQRDLPEESRASAFGRSETVLQLAWVFGGALGVLLPHSTFWIGFAVIAGVVALAGVQSALVARRAQPAAVPRAPHPAGQAFRTAPEPRLRSVVHVLRHLLTGPRRRAAGSRLRGRAAAAPAGDVRGRRRQRRRPARAVLRHRTHRVPHRRRRAGAARRAAGHAAAGHGARRRSRRPRGRSCSATPTRPATPIDERSRCSPPTSAATGRWSCPRRRTGCSPRRCSSTARRRRPRTRRPGRWSSRSAASWVRVERDGRLTEPAQPSRSRATARTTSAASLQVRRSG